MRRHPLLDIEDVAAAVAAAIAEDVADPFDRAFLVSGLGDIRAAGDQVQVAEFVARLGTVNFTAPAEIGAALAGRMAARGHGALVFIGRRIPCATLRRCLFGLKSRACSLCRRFAAQRAPAWRHRDADFARLCRHGRRAPQPGCSPFAMQPDVVAERITRAVASQQPHLILPWPFALLRLFDRLLPAALRDRLLIALTPPG